MELKQGYKQTELGIIPENWDIKELGVLGEVKMCKRIFNYQTKPQGDIPFFKIGTFGKEPDAFITNELYSNFRQRFSFPKKGTLLISAAGTIGRTIVYDGQPSYFQDSNIVWIENEERIVPNSLLFHILQTVNYNTEGGTIQRLYNSILKSTKFIYPAKAEQTAIANALSDIDDLISKTEKLIYKKKAIKQGVMQELLKPKDGWVTKRISEVCWFQEGPGVRKHQFTHSGVKLLNGTNIQEGKLDLENTDKFIAEDEAFGWYSHFLVDENDILIACSGVSIDKFHEKVTVAKVFHLPLCMNTSTMRFKVKKGYLDQGYFIQFLKSKRFKEQISGKATGSAQLNFGPSHVTMVEIDLPGIEIQNKIGQVLSDMEMEIGNFELKLKKLSFQKQGMMQALLTGKIRLL